ncbi:hypothetical protein BB561_000202 [Smittium simulii]|uniref:BD-FAE-like domain-containing protein n=1 Tax=Smittium simulii TaxID=133385 RepID=A0A2T9Z021_9FUNG|nr:hypothetical protein BB561_000202 [Smittium simulii]
MTIKEYLDVPYVSSKPDPLQTLDLYVPAASSNNDQPLPELLVYVHGGCWRSGDKNEYVSFARNIAAMQSTSLQKPLAVAILNYRLSSETEQGTKHPDQFMDCVYSIEYLINSAHQYGFDPTRIHLVGHSAGGHLTGLLALDPPHAWWEVNVPGHSITIAQAIRTVVGISGIYDHNYVAQVHPGYDEFTIQTFGNNTDYWDATSPQFAPLSEAHKKLVEHIYPPGYIPHGAPLSHMKYFLVISTTDELMKIETTTHYSKHLAQLGLLSGENISNDYGSHFGQLDNPDLQNSQFRIFVYIVHLYISATVFLCMDSLPTFFNLDLESTLEQIYLSITKKYDQSIQFYLLSLDLITVLDSVLQTLPTDVHNDQSLLHANPGLYTIIHILYCLYRASTQKNELGFDPNNQFAVVYDRLLSKSFDKQTLVLTFLDLLFSQTTKFDSFTPTRVFETCSVFGLKRYDGYDEVPNILSSLHQLDAEFDDTTKNIEHYAFTDNESKVLISSCILGLDKFIEQNKVRSSELKKELEKLLSNVIETHISLSEHKQIMSLISEVGSLDDLEILFQPSVRALVERGPNLVKSICYDHLSKNSYNRLICAALTRPLTITLHNALIEVILVLPKELEVETWHRYLSTVDSTCQTQEHKSIAQMQNAKLACKLFYKFIHNKTLTLEKFKVELLSFCLSYVYIKDAAELYALVSNNSSSNPRH